MKTELDESGIRIFADTATECQYLEAMTKEKDMQLVRIKNTNKNNLGEGLTWHYLIKPASDKLLLGLVANVVS